MKYLLVILLLTRLSASQEPGIVACFFHPAAKNASSGFGSSNIIVFNDGSSHGTATIYIGAADHMEWIKLNLESAPFARVIVEPRIINANLYGDNYKPVAGQLAPSAKIIDACASCDRFTINISRLGELKQRLAAVEIELMTEIDP